MRYKKTILIGGLLVLSVGWVVMLMINKGDEEEGNENEINKTGLIKEEVTISENTREGVNKDEAESISFVNNEDKTMSGMMVYRKKEVEFDKTFLKRIEENLGSVGDLIVDDESVLIYVNEEKESYLNWNKDNKELTYGKNITTTTRQNKELVNYDEAANIIIEKISRIYNLSSRIILERKSIEKQSDFIMTMIGYKLNNLEVVSQWGWPVIAKVTYEGEIIELKVRLTAIEVEEITEKKVMSLESLRRIPVSEFMIIEIRGGENFAYTWGPEMIRNINITTTNMGYMDEANNQYLIPYFLMEGNSMVSSKPIRIKLGMNALLKNTNDVHE